MDSHVRPSRSEQIQSSSFRARLAERSQIWGGGVGMGPYGHTSYESAGIARSPREILQRQSPEIVVGKRSTPQSNEDIMDEEHIQDFEKMTGIVERVEAGKGLESDDAQWIMAEFVGCVELLNSAIGDANAHCRMLHNLCTACAEEDQGKIDNAIAEAVAYHAEPEAPAKGGGNGKVLQ